MKFMFAPGQEVNAGSINGLYTLYLVLKSSLERPFVQEMGIQRISLNLQRIC
jgi:hypothetical protein